jgi:dihydroorotate dehydrogenase (fumarate)
MIDLTTTYLGMKLKNPLVVSASPLSENIENIRRMEEAGAAAVVMHSLFEEQITLESHELDCHLCAGAESYAESLTYFPELASYNLGPEAYVEHVRKAKQAVKIPIIGSLNGVSMGTATNWIDYARKIQDAGADALELNIYFIPTDPDMTGDQVEQLYCQLVRAVKQAGADGLVLFNRFFQPDFDLESLTVVPHLNFSRPTELLLRLHWVAVLFPQLNADMAVTGGVHSATDALKAMMAGARVAMMTSSLLKEGIGHLKTVLRDLERWMTEHEYKSIHEMQGSMSHWAVAEPAAFERGNYLRVLGSYRLDGKTR